MDRIFCVTVQRCVACGKCELACAFTYGSDGVPGTPRIRIVRTGPERGVPLACFQCHDAACVAVCPVAALSRHDATGAIAILSERCIGCGMCVAACPFGNMVWDEQSPGVAKCDLCGGAPRCVPFCATR
ncbi:MAG TPA: 4Fe-4S dicluster domain-containing protein, partial [Candidatus Sulfotelmatobacter sp.]|nr:4Fe-4S dicluster domain-containing protein [Candidatus Sulfotelmatobacter sp.]